MGFGFVDFLTVLFGFLPPWFVLIILICVLIAFAILIFKLVAFVMDVIPFI